MAGSTNGLRLLDYLFEHPLISVRMAEIVLKCSYVTASNVVRDFKKLGILKEVTGRQRNRLFRYEPYVSLFDRQALTVAGSQESEPVRTTLREPSEQ